MSEIAIEVDGLKYVGWENITVTRSIETFCGSFSFQGSYIIGKEFPVKLNNACKIYINNILVLTGFIYHVVLREDANTHNITVSGFDKTYNIIRNTIGSDEMNISPPITLVAIVEKILKSYNMTGIKVIDPYNLSPIKDAVVSYNIGETAEDFLQSWAAKKNVLITTTPDGNIIFQRAGTETYKTVLTKHEKDLQSIKSSTLTLDNTKRFHKYIISNQANSMSDYWVGNQRPPSETSDIGAEAIDNGVDKTSIYYLTADDVGVVDDVQKRVQWEANFRRAQSLTYECNVQGFSPKLDTHTIWLPNKLVRIDNPRKNIKGSMLISSVIYKKDANGSVTTLKCVTRDSFTNEVNKPRKQEADEVNFAQFWTGKSE